MPSRSRKLHPIALKTCIYCLERKQDTEEYFNAEHVLLKALGRFEANWVLNDVCIGCNSHFSETLDLAISRDSYEGITRFLRGHKQPKEFKSLGARSKVSVRLEHGPYRGAPAYFAANENTNQLDVKAAPAIGFLRNGDEAAEAHWIRPNELPTYEEFKWRFGVRKGEHFSLRTQGMRTEEATSLLRDRGFTVSEWSETPAPIGEVDTQIVGTIGRDQLRAASKLAFNYLAKVASPALVRAPQFDELRRYIRRDEGTARIIVGCFPWKLLNAQREPARGHYVGVRTLPNGQIVAQVSFFFDLQYTIWLSHTPLATVLKLPNFNHIFDLDTRTIRDCRMLPFVLGNPLENSRTAAFRPLNTGT